MIATTMTKAVYLGNGVTREFPIPFAYADKKDVKVRLYDIALNQETEVLTGFWINEEEHVVVYPGHAPGQGAPLPEQPPVLTEGFKLIVCRETPVQQLTSLGSKYPLPVLEAMIDRNTMIAQEAKEQFSRCVMLDMGAGTGLDSWKTAKGFLLDVERRVRVLAESAQQMKEYVEHVQIDAQHVDAALQQTAENAQRAAQLAQTVQAALDGAGVHVLQRGKAYAAGDVAFCRNLPSWARLECVKAGTTAAAEPAAFAQMSSGGVLITDGAAVWIVDDVRDGARVGDIILRPTLRDGYIKANGATVKASEYPRLVAWVQESNMIVTAEQYAQDCSKYVYDRAADTLTLPNMTGRVLQGGESVKSVKAGLPNIDVKIRTERVDKASGKGEVSVFVDSPSTGRGGTGGRSFITCNASKYNPIYGASETVQPPAIALIAQIKY